MNATSKSDLVSVADYLADEIESPVKREYVGGHVYVRAETTNRHNAIAGNVTAHLYRRLTRPCRAWNSDTKIRIRLPTHTRFYYPDVSVVRRPNPPDDVYHDAPVVVAEVLSAATRRLDEVEKKDGYLAIGSLDVYLLIEPTEAEVVAHRRTDFGFVREVYHGLDAVIPLPEVGTELPLAEVYDRVGLVPEPTDEADEPTMV